MLGALDILPFEVPADTAYGVIRSRHEQIGRPIGGNDLLIGAHAYALRLVLATGNQLRVYDATSGALDATWPLPASWL